MKKILLFVLTFVLVISFASCTKNENTEDVVSDPGEITDPVVPDFTEYESLEELNEAMGTHFVKPGIMGITDESFITIGENTEKTVISQYKFSANGVDYAMRCAGTLDDISGIYGSDGTVFAGKGITETYGETAEYMVTRMFSTDGQYVLSVNSKDMGKETFMGVADEIFALIKEAADQTSDGDEAKSAEYQDEVGKRATMVMTEIDNGASIVISWADSVDKTTTWTMTADLDPDAHLAYSDCKCVTIENGVETTVYENGEGYFETDGEKIFWTGAEDENCRECVFAKTE